MRIVFLSGRWDAAGRFRRWAGLAPSAQLAELAAAANAAGHDAILVDEPGIHVADEIVRLVGQYEPDEVVICVNTLPSELIVSIRQGLAVPVLTVADGTDETAELLVNSATDI